MGTKRTHNIMARLNEAEFNEVFDALPDGEELAVFARRLILEGVRHLRGTPNSFSLLLRAWFRFACAFTGGFLSNDKTPEEVAKLFDDYLAAHPELLS